MIGGINMRVYKGSTILAIFICGIALGIAIYTCINLFISAGKMSDPNATYAIYIRDHMPVATVIVKDTEEGTSFLEPQVLFIDKINVAGIIYGYRGIEATVLSYRDTHTGNLYVLDPAKTHGIYIPLNNIRAVVPFGASLSQLEVS
jgi:hypothetical protein